MPDTDEDSRLLALDDALSRLAAEDAQAARVVALHHFGGLSHELAAEALGLTVYQVRQKWTYARVAPGRFGAMISKIFHFSSTARANKSHGRMPMQRRRHLCRLIPSTSKRCFYQLPNARLRRNAPGCWSSNAAKTTS